MTIASEHLRSGYSSYFGYYVTMGSMVSTQLLSATVATTELAILELGLCDLSKKNGETCRWRKKKKKNSVPESGSEVNIVHM